MNNTIVYRHRTLSTKEVFYVGIGSIKRAKSKERSQYWKNIVKKHGYTIELIAYNLSWETACELEELLIQTYGRRDLGTGQLVNLTNGGEGSPGVIVSDSTKSKLSLLNKGKKLSDEHKLKIGLANKGKKPSEITRKRQLETISKKVIHIPSKTVYDSVKEAAKAHTLNYLNLTRRLNGTYKNITNFKYY